MTKRFVKVYTTDFAIPCGEMKAIPEHSILRHRPRRVVKFHIPKAVKASLFDMGGQYDEDGWDYHATREDFKAHFKELFNDTVDIMDQVPERDIGRIMLHVFSTAFRNAREVNRVLLRADPALGHHPSTYTKKLSAIRSIYGEHAAKFYVVIHDLIVDYIAARI